MRQESCPNADDLRKFVRCSVTEQQAESIADHLEVCPACEETVVGLERDGDTVADHIRKAAAEPTFSHEPECQQIMASLLERTALSGPSAPPTGLESPMAQSLRDYQIIAMLGEGGMGAVYKAVHQRLKKTVALKVLPTNRIGDQPAVARFEREMSVLGQLNHPNIVQALDAGEHDGQHYLVMEYVEGSDLSDIVKRCSPLSIADACQLISQAATGLQYAHEHGFVHRDIKPSNLMLATTERHGGESQAIVKILDLGLARALEQPTAPATAKADLTTTGQVMGTLDYMAPEQGGDAHQVDIRADIYSLGATLYKLLTGDSPYAEHAHKPPLQRLMAIAQHEPPAIRAKRPDVPEKLAAIVHRMLSKKPENRYATPAEVTQALEPFCAGANSAALLSPQESTRILDTRSQVTIPLKPSNTGRNTGRRWRTTLAGFAAFVLLAAVVLITTRNGTVEVSSPDGKLPDDVKVVVSRGGEEIELLQADNQWSAKVVNGEYQVQLRGRDDRFEIKDSKLIVTRLGKAIVELQSRATASKPVPEPKPPAVVNVVPKNPSKPEPILAPANPETPVAPLPETILPDREKPFVVLSPEGKVLGEYKFISEALAVSPGDLILEVHGNGPFKLSQIVRENCALTIKAANGYRPRFETGFEIQEAELNTWLRLQEVELTVTNCDFFARPKGNHVIFAGNGKQWTIRSCRLIQASNSSALMGFYGERLEIRDSLLASRPLDLRPTVELTFVNNVCLLGATFNIHPNQNQRARVSSNLFYLGEQFNFNLRATPTSRTEITASNNLFMPGYGRMVIEWQPSEAPPQDVFQWIGRGNRFAPFQTGPLWMESAELKATKPPRTVEEWNTFWGNSDDLRLVKEVRFEWDYLSLPDWTEGAKRFTKELKVARQKHPKLAKLGPEMELVGAGDAYDRIRNGGELPAKDQRPDPLEGGPFVVVRDGQPPRGFLTLDTATAAAQSGDEIEIRSDVKLRKVELISHSDKVLTLRAATGYRPVLTGLWLDSGNWSVEGLHLQQEVIDGRVLTGKVRRLANCTLSSANVHCNLELPTGHKQTLEIVNCYSSVPIGVASRDEKNTFGVKLDNSVVSLILANSPDEGAIEVSRCCLWSHIRPGDFHQSAGETIALESPETWQAKVTDSLLDASMVVLASKLKWQGERNLYRLHSGDWGGFEPPSGISMWRRSLDEWRAIWNSDTDSESDDSAILRPELWRERKQ